MQIVKKWIPLLLASVLVLAGGFYYWRSTASYAVLEIERALRERDLAAFYMRLDLDRVLSSTIDAASTRQNLQAGTWNGLSRALSSGLSKALNAQARTQIKSDIEQHFLTQKAQPAFSQAIDEALGVIAPSRNLLVRISHLERGSLAVSGDKALLNIKAHIGLLDRSYPLILVLERKPLWIIVGFEGLATTLDSFDRDVTTFLDTYNREQRESMEEILGFSPGAVTKDDFMGFNRQLRVAMNFKNRGTSLIQSILGWVALKDQSGAVLIEYPIHIPEARLNPDEVRTFSIGPDLSLMDKNAQKVFEAQGIQLSFRPEALGRENLPPLRQIKSLDAIETVKKQP